MNRKELKGIRSQKLEEMIREWQPWKGEMDHGMSIIINTMHNILFIYLYNEWWNIRKLYSKKNKEIYPVLLYGNEGGLISKLITLYELLIAHSITWVPIKPAPPVTSNNSLFFIMIYFYC